MVSRGGARGRRLRPEADGTWGRGERQARAPVSVTSSPPPRSRPPPGSTPAARTAAAPSATSDPLPGGVHRLDVGALHPERQHLHVLLLARLARLPLRRLARPDLHAALGGLGELPAQEALAGRVRRPPDHLEVARLELLDRQLRPARRRGRGGGLRGLELGVQRGEAGVALGAAAMDLVEREPGRAVGGRAVVALPVVALPVVALVDAREPIVERALREVVKAPEWAEQRRRWRGRRAASSRMSALPPRLRPSYRAAS